MSTRESSDVEGGDLLASLPVASSVRFAEDIRAIVDKLDNPEVALLAIVNNYSAPDAKRFAALYGILHRYRRDHQNDKFSALLSAHALEFGHEPYVHTFWATEWHTRRARTRADLEAALAASESALKGGLSGRPGVLHQFAAISADLIVILPLGRERRKLTANATDRCRSAIRVAVTPNANFHATLALLLSADSRHAEAQEEIGKAISLQDARSRDAIRRLARFESIRSEISFSERQAIFRTEFQDARESLREARRDQVQMLGILAAAIALITTTTTLSTRVEGPGAIRVILAGCGAVTMAFAALMWGQGGKGGRLVVSLLIGLSMVAGSLMGWIT